MSELDNVATPAVSAVASSTTSTATPPISALGALEKAASAASSPVTPGAGTVAPTPKPSDTPTPDSIAAATNQPATGAQEQGEAPQRRIEAAVRNARAEVEKQFAWAKGLDPERVHAALDIVNSIRKDPHGLIQELAKTVGMQLPQPVLPDDAFPEPDLQSEDGSKKAYSDVGVRKALDFQKRQLLNELAPILDFVGNLHQERTQAAATDGAGKKATALLGEVRELPHFKENEAAIAEKLRVLNTEHPEQVKELGVPAALYRCYNQVLAETVFPNINKDAEQRVREGFNKKVASSSGSVHPTSVGGEGKKAELRNPADLARHMERLAAAVSQ